LLLEEFGAEFVHVKGRDNVVADALSRMDADYESRLEDLDKDAIGQLHAHAMSHMIREESYAMPKKNKGLAKKLITEAQIMEERFPLLPSLIQREQAKDKTLQRLQKEQPNEFGTRELEKAQVITFKDRIYVPQALCDRIVAWYHDYLSHPGKVQMQSTLASTLYWPNMEKTIYSYVKKCPSCQLCKGPRKPYGKLPLKIWDNPKPWQ
jgi:hypothetical protein